MYRTNICFVRIPSCHLRLNIHLFVMSTISQYLKLCYGRDINNLYCFLSFRLLTKKLTGPARIYLHCSPKKGGHLFSQQLYLQYCKKIIPFQCKVKLPYLLFCSVADPDASFFWLTKIRIQMSRRLKNVVKQFGLFRNLKLNAEEKTCTCTLFL